MIPAAARAAALWAALLCALAAPTARGEEVVRIAVATGLARVRVAGPGLTLAPLREGAAPAPVAGDAAVVALEDGAVTVNGVALEGAGALFVAAGRLTTSASPVGLEEGELEVRRAADGLAVLHALPLEDYVAAVVGSEMPPSFPPAALQAQAVAARTFAVFKKLEALQAGRPWHMGATVLDQVYRGAVDPRARAAAEATAGQVLTFEHEPIAAYFHSACGGRTERGADALGRDLPYLLPVVCRGCHGAPLARWTRRIGADELARKVGLPGEVRRAEVVARSASGRAARVELWAGGRRAVIGAVDLRQRIGYDRLPSLAFDLHLAGGAAVFEGRGSGHGAGLCQWGAAGAARAGDDYRTILDRYYPGTQLTRMY